MNINLAPMQQPNPPTPAAVAVPAALVARAVAVRHECNGTSNKPGAYFIKQAPGNHFAASRWR